ncbi:TonB-dependent receptor plug domain-containing protein [Draconibacterium orientale]|uniref:TonB-dependent receptor plug domain-containing protein n=1 Tax=Draconibacterium orientale TaxID=1168034 RepID=UPI0029C604D5|nr:TonB-dependent receptor plug domain-containing protein [Draconibacterium orientale]
MGKILLMLSLFTLSFSSYCQVKIVRGQVTAHEEIPLVGAAIYVKSTNKVYKTDSLGHYRIQCSIKDKITVSANGFIKEEIKIRKKSKYVLVNLKLKSGEENKDLAMGYVNVADKDKLYAIKAIDDDEMDYSSFRNIHEVLTGNFPGLQIQNGEIVIRNTASFTGDNAALIIIDGRESTMNSLENIATSDIKNISVMKDASASMYGSRGANGVVIVSTKRGDK